jgi:hypothetical protein
VATVGGGGAAETETHEPIFFSGKMCRYFYFHLSAADGFVSERVDLPIWIRADGAYANAMLLLYIRDTSARYVYAMTHAKAS